MVTSMNLFWFFFCLMENIFYNKSWRFHVVVRFFCIFIFNCIPVFSRLGNTALRWSQALKLITAYLFWLYILDVVELGNVYGSIKNSVAVKLVSTCACLRVACHRCPSRLVLLWSCDACTLPAVAVGLLQRDVICSYNTSSGSEISTVLAAMAARRRRHDVCVNDDVELSYVGCSYSPRALGRGWPLTFPATADYSSSAGEW